MNASAKDLASLLPPGFTLGVATSAFQIEGALDEDGRGPSGWDVFAAKPGSIVEDHSPAVSCDHYHRMPEDVALMKELGIDSYRFSLSWSRIQPGGSGPVNPAGLDFYDRLIDLLLANGISPMATLYHWDTPLPLDEAGGWMNRDTAYRLGDFAAIAAAAFGDRVSRWVTVNEPATVTTNGYALGMHAPGRGPHAQGPPQRAPPAAGPRPGAPGAACRQGAGRHRHHQRLLTDGPGHREPAGQGQCRTHGRGAKPALRGPRAARQVPGRHPGRHLLFVVLQPVQRRHGADLPAPGFLWPELLHAHPCRRRVRARGPCRPGMAEAMGDDLSGTPGAPFHIAPFPDTETTAYGWPIKPEYMSVALAEMAERYPDLPPVFITEGGASFEDVVIQPPGRTAGSSRTNGACATWQTTSPRPWKRRHPGGAAEAIDLRGYYVWSLMDNFEWSAGYKQPFGLLHVDRDTQDRTPKASLLLAPGSHCGPQRGVRRRAGQRRAARRRRRAGRNRRRLRAPPGGLTPLKPGQPREDPGPAGSSPCPRRPGSRSTGRRTPMWSPVSEWPPAKTASLAESCRMPMAATWSPCCCAKSE